VVGLARQVDRNTEALAGYAESMRCHLGDFGEYAALRAEVKERESALAREGAAQIADPLALREDGIQPPAGKLPLEPPAKSAEVHAPQVGGGLAQHRAEHAGAACHRHVRGVVIQLSAHDEGAGSLCRSLEDAIFIARGHTRARGRRVRPCTQPAARVTG